MFRYHVGDSVGDGALHLLSNGATGLLPKMTHKRDLSAASTRDLALNNSSSHGSIRLAEANREPTLTHDQELILQRLRRSQKKEKSFDFGAKTEQEEAMNNRAITGLFATLSDINYDKDAVAKNLAPIHAAVASAEREKKVTATTQKRLEQSRSHLSSALPKKKAPDSKVERQMSNPRLKKNAGQGLQKHKATAAADIMARHPSQKAMKHILE